MKNYNFLKALRENRTRRIIISFLVLNLLIEIVSPTIALGLTSGPSQPEFSSFEPVATTDMVNDFTGDFTYNLPVLSVPGPDGGGYSMSLSYHSGVSSEEEASWVGFGWTLNPGAINRNKRGHADEFDGIKIVNYNKVKPNWSQSAKFDLNIEINSSDKSPSESGKGMGQSAGKIAGKLSSDKPEGGSGGEDDSDDPGISLNLSHTIRYNNYTGFSIANGIGIGIKGMASVSMNRSGNQNTYGFSVNPRALLSSSSNSKKQKTQEDQQTTATSTEQSAKKEKSIMNAPDPSQIKSQAKGEIKGAIKSNIYAILLGNAPALGYSVAKHGSGAWNFSGSFQLNPTPSGFGFQVGIAGSMDVQVMEGAHETFAHGYLKSAGTNGNTAEDQVFDYQIEKESTFDKHDKNLGIPFNNADMFTATGNGVIGGFRAQFDRIGSFHPNFSTNVSKIRQIGVEGGFGETFQAGLDFGIGKQTTIVTGNWPKMPSMTNKEFSTATPQMRFTNDPGGELNYSDDYDKLKFATIKLSKELDLGSDFDLGLDAAKNSNSSDIECLFSGTAPTPVLSPNNPSIKGIKITNKDGGKSNYEQPVYTKNETDLTVGLSNFDDGKYLVENPLSYDNPLDNSTAVGQRITEPYASSYLLTSNTTYNYVDADGNGKPSDGDFGGWTKFAYKQAYGNDVPGTPAPTNEWYRYRSPYSGLKYNKGRHLDPKDQTGSMSSGDKQVFYLKCIETKSHIAFFVTNNTTANTFTANFPVADYGFLYNGTNPISTVTLNTQGSATPRLDGIDAAAISGGMDPAANNLSAVGSHTLEKLEKIVLFAKNDLSHPLTTTFFEYDNSLCQGIPNTTAGGSSPLKDRGKLTLKKIWTESNGVNRSRIAPYQFDYEYFHNYPTEVINKYSWADLEFNQKWTSNDVNQNPAYKPWQLDCWGNYQEDGDKRFENEQYWVSQKKLSSTSKFDPAAWQLKRIQLPSGGEIHVNYEQKDYSSLQDKTPTAMVSLLYDPINEDNYDSDHSIFSINVDDISVDPGELNQYKDLLKDYFVSQKNKLYFKALYAFTGEDTPQLNQEDRRFEYVSGYTVVHDVKINNGKIQLYLGDTRSDCLGGGGKKDKTLPRYVCYQELLTNGGQNLGLSGYGYKDEDNISYAYGNPQDAVQEALNASRGEVFMNTIQMFGDWLGGKVRNVRKVKACRTLSYDLSYFKLPVLHAKKGGGVRVKRLLTYDPGISTETGDAMIYGSEYIYKNEDGSSSGVATNEPAPIREENALVTLMERKKQTWIDKIKNGRDTKQFEGPLGENIMPSASIVHSRVIIKNIHSGKSSTGYLVNKYNTIKDYPMDVDFSPISKKDKTYRKFDLTIPMGIFTLSMSKAWITQGYIFKMNDMNGKLASKTTYAGDYSDSNFNEIAFTSKTIYNYSQPGQKISSIVYDPHAKNMSREFLNPGMEEDYTIFTANVREKANDFSVESDFNLSLPILPSAGSGPSFSFTDKLLCQHITSKVVSQTSYLLSTTTINDGVTQTTENIAFDKYTNEPVLTMTYDGYVSPQEKILTQNGGGSPHQGYYYSLNIPASWIYPDMGPKTLNALNTNQLTSIVGNVVTYSTNSLFDALTANTNTGVVWSPVGNPLTNVVSASATTYSNNWFNSSMVSEYPTFTNTAVLSQVNTVNYPITTYSYKDDVKSANAVGGKIYYAGMVTNPFKFFDWLNPSSIPAEWYSENRITMYSPNGYAVEETDNLGIVSSARFGYQNLLPVLVAKNAGFNQTQFTDFEYGFGNNANVVSDYAHSGRASYNLSSNPQYPFVTNYNLSQSMVGSYTTPGHGLSIKFWLKSLLSSAPSSQYYGRKNQAPQAKALIGSKSFDLKAIAQTGDWTLYSAEILDFKGLTPGNYNINLSYNMQANEEVRIDDFRIQPLDASMNCSVYYSDNKLAAQFDDQHFGVFYEYNNRGQLTRKSIETERGKKTLQEQQYNVPLIDKQ